MDFAERLEYLLKTDGLSRSQLGKMVNANTTTVSNWIVGRHKPSNKTMIQLAHVFNCSIPYLLGETEEKGSPPEVRGDHKAINPDADSLHLRRAEAFPSLLLLLPLESQDRLFVQLLGELASVLSVDAVPKDLLSD